MNDVEERAMAVGKLFVGLGVEPSAEQVAIFVEATQRQSLAHLRAAVDHILRTKGEEQGFPRPGEVNAVARRMREREESIALQAGRQRALPSGDTREERMGRVVSLAAAVRALRLPRAGGE